MLEYATQRFLSKELSAHPTINFLGRILTNDRLIWFVMRRGERELYGGRFGDQQSRNKIKPVLTASTAAEAERVRKEQTTMQMRLKKSSYIIKLSNTHHASLVTEHCVAAH